MNKKESGYTKGQKALAWTGIGTVALLLTGLAAAILSGADAGVILSLLFCLMVVPCVIFGISSYIKMTVKRRGDMPENEDGAAVSPDEEKKEVDA